MKPNMHAVFALIAFGLITVCGCYVGKTSPWVYGLDVRVAPGFKVGDGRVTVHPTAAYARSVIGGVEEERDDIMHLGGQVRYALRPGPGVASGWWFGGEATYARRRTSFDAPGVAPEMTNGWTIAALAGHPLVHWPFGTVHGYGAAGINKYGGTGPYLRAGLDFQPAFSRR